MKIIKTKRRKRARTHGFRSRKATPGGRAVLKRRRQKQRKALAVKVRRS